VLGFKKNPEEIQNKKDMKKCDTKKPTCIYRRASRKKCSPTDFKLCFSFKQVKPGFTNYQPRVLDKKFEIPLRNQIFSKF